MVSSELTIDRKQPVHGAIALLWGENPRASFRSISRVWSRPVKDRVLDSREILLDGPAGTGKTFGVCRRCDWLAREYPGCRILWMRETLKSLRQSVQQIYEDHILWPGHPALARGGKERTEYDYQNGRDGRPSSKIVLGGLDNPGLWMSTEFDVIVFFEATNRNIEEAHWNHVKTTRLRGRGIPHPLCRYPDGILEDGRTVNEALEAGEGAEGGRFEGARDEDGHDLFFQQAIAECNPSLEFGDQCWVWKRWQRGEMVRLQSTHRCNPTLAQSYLDDLNALPGRFRDVFFLGQWTPVRGRIWDAYNPKTHIINGRFDRDELTGRRWITINDWQVSGAARTFAVASVIAGYDWGVEHPGSLQVLAVCGEGPAKVAFRIAQVHRTARGLEWWADRLRELVDRFKIEAVACPPERPDVTELFNLRLGPSAARDVGGICQSAQNRRVTGTQGDMGGLDLVNEMFRAGKLFLFRDCLVGGPTDAPADEVLAMKHRPTCLEDEIPAYVRARDTKDPERLLEVPDKTRSIDDACDALRYACMDVFRNERTVKPRSVLEMESDPWRVLSPEEEAYLEARKRMQRGVPIDLRSFRGAS